MDAELRKKLGIGGAKADVPKFQPPDRLKPRKRCAVAKGRGAVFMDESRVLKSRPGHRYLARFAKFPNSSLCFRIGNWRLDSLWIIA